MKPKPLASLNHFTVPVIRAICPLLLARCVERSERLSQKRDEDLTANSPGPRSSPLVFSARHRAVAPSLARTIVNVHNEVKPGTRLNEYATRCNLVALCDPPFPSCCSRYSEPGASCFAPRIRPLRAHRLIAGAARGDSPPWCTTRRSSRAPRDST